MFPINASGTTRNTKLAVQMSHVLAKGFSVTTAENEIMCMAPKERNCHMLSSVTVPTHAIAADCR